MTDLARHAAIEWQDLELRARAQWAIREYHAPTPPGEAGGEAPAQGSAMAVPAPEASEPLPRRWPLVVEVIGWIALALLVAAPWVLLLTD